MAIPGGFSSGDVLTAADMNGLPAGVMAHTSTTTPFYLSGGYQNVLQATFTADASRLYRLSFFCSSAMTVANNRAQIQFIDDTSSIKGRAYQGGYAYGSIINYVTLALFTAGSRTLTVQAYRDIGSSTVSFFADALSPIRLWVEDIGEA